MNLSRMIELASNETELKAAVDRNKFKIVKYAGLGWGAMAVITAVASVSAGIARGVMENKPLPEVKEAVIPIHKTDLTERHTRGIQKAIALTQPGDSCDALEYAHRNYSEGLSSFPDLDKRIEDCQIAYKIEYPRNPANRRRIQIDFHHKADALVRDIKRFASDDLDYKQLCPMLAEIDAENKAEGHHWSVKGRSYPSAHTLCDS